MQHTTQTTVLGVEADGVGYRCVAYWEDVKRINGLWLILL